MNLSTFSTLTGYILGILIAFVLTGIFRLSLKWILRILTNSIIGCVIMYILTAIAKIYAPLNPVEAVFLGISGLPGVVVLLILKIII